MGVVDYVRGSFQLSILVQIVAFVLNVVALLKDGSSEVFRLILIVGRPAQTSTHTRARAEPPLCRDPRSS